MRATIFTQEEPSEVCVRKGTERNGRGAKTRRSTRAFMFQINSRIEKNSFLKTERYRVSLSVTDDPTGSPVRTKVFCGAR